MKTLTLDNSEQAFILYNALLSHKDRRVEIHTRSIERYTKNGEPWEGAIADHREQLNKFLNAYDPIEKRLKEIVQEGLIY